MAIREEDERDEAIDRLIRDVMAGKVVTCETCKLPLTYYGPKSGRHPGVFCPTGCTAIYMEMGPRSSEPK